ncbi:glycosyltransferase family 2 protein [Pelagicoccus sp. NFK12]|uniref:Glycosyltransferase family 2 protein n=1 Tax=Pelagicoccus enzymogenes TaxID=2773457 RepID=A0A927F9P9_9BACT|nr:glycosyltransferase family 2 protein [Pelagicoccus enzymogenes]MBD5781073.1 glycosyltransferase family 2 protein [Pelagicoccus enzymogenes]
MILPNDSKESPKLSIIIVNWNSKSFVVDCLNSLEKHCSDISYEVIIVDGASFDGCEEALKIHHPRAKYIQSHENIGFGRCNNLGFQYARAELILLLNPDTEVTKNSIQHLINVSQASKHFGIIGAKLLNTNGTLQTSSVQSLPTPWNQALDSNFLRAIFPRWPLWGTHEAYSRNSPTSVEAISGACMLISRETFDKVGGFTKSFFMYAEDMDLCFKVKQLGLNLIYCPDSVIFHHGGGSSSEQTSHFSEIKKRESLIKYFNINSDRKTANNYIKLQAISAKLRILLSYLFGKKDTLIKWKKINNFLLKQKP